MKTLALPRGRLLDECLAWLARAGFDTSKVEADSRTLSVDCGPLRLAFVKPADIPVMVARGRADLGITGTDRLEESGVKLQSLIKPGFGFCRLVLASLPEQDIKHMNRPLIATSFPVLATRYLKQSGFDPKILNLSGSVELGISLHGADAVVDLVQTGSTLKANGLVEVSTLCAVESVLVAAPEALIYDCGSLASIIKSLEEVAS